MKAGKKYIVEVEEEYKGCPNLYRIKGFRSLVFDENGLNNLQELNDIYCIKFLQDSAWLQNKIKLTKTKFDPTIEDVISQARKEGYIQGCKDTWDTLSKII